MVSQIRRFLKGIPVTAETLAVDTIAAIGPGNHYLTHPQTKAHYRQQIWMPELISPAVGGRSGQFDRKKKRMNIESTRGGL